MFAFSGTGTTDTDGTVTTTPASGGWDYTVAPDGALSLATGTLVGGIAPSGRYAVAAGATAGGGAPFLFFGLR
jgi:hypothetical protein